jgi:hypothetical protein
MAAPFAVSINVDGLEQTKRRTLDYGKRAPGAFLGALYIVSTNIISTAMKLTPVATGWLRLSRYVEKPAASTMTTARRASIEAGFSAPYALFVHEIFKRYYVGEWKFLTKAIAYQAGRVQGDLANWTRRLSAAGQTIDDLSVTHPTTALQGPTRRMKLTKRQKAAREKGRAKNDARIQRESGASLKAQREGKSLPHPGRG